jgi:hypothetical protein
MEFVSWRTGAEYLFLGVSWRTGAPCLDVIDVEARTPYQFPMFLKRLGVKRGTSGKFCTGRFGIVAETSTERVPCAAERLAKRSGQCEQCAAQDEFKLIHHVHTGGQATPALTRYMAQPHWVYIATFADAASKVGTAAELRKKSRLAEQGPIMASFVARAADGKIARYIEDAVTRTLEVSQFKRGAAKVAALASPVDSRIIAEHHDKTVKRAGEMVDDWARRSSGVAPLAERWNRPEEMEPFLGPRQAGGWTPYPHDLQSGQHRLFVDACAGQGLLARTSESEQDDDPVRYTVDLGKLKGLRIVTGDYSSPEFSVQSALF